MNNLIVWVIRFVVITVMAMLMITALGLVLMAYKYILLWSGLVDITTLISLKGFSVLMMLSLITFCILGYLLRNPIDIFISVVSTSLDKCLKRMRLM